MGATVAGCAAETPRREAIETAAFVLALRARGVRDTTVLGAMERVPRELFAPRRFADLARTDVALPLPCGQTMTAPGTVATMLVALAAETGQSALEVGTGTGYVSALLVRLGCRVRTIERYATLAESARARFAILGLAVDGDVGDGLAPWRSSERFERILVNGSLRALPQTLTSLLVPGGRLVGAIVVDGFPRLIRIDRHLDGRLAQELGGPLRLSPLVGGRAAAL